MRRRRVLMPFAGIACVALLAVSGSARMSAAAFGSNLTIAGNGVTVDRLSNHFEVTPGPLASGDVESLVLGGIGGGEGAPAVGRSASRPLVDVSALAPERAVESSVTVTNVGTVPGTFVLQAAGSGSRPLAEALRLEVTSGGRVLYDRPLAGFEDVPLGLLAPGENLVVDTRVALSPAAGNDLQGLSAGVDLRVAALS